MSRPKLILGSGSPRRAELLGQLGLRADEVRPPDVDETPLNGELPLNYCRRIAGAKADAMQVGVDEVVLCADTTVALGRRIMGKPRDEGEAAAFLRALAGRRHKVITSVVVRNAQGRWSRDVTTAVKLKRLSDQELAAYLASNDWQGKAGGYAIQGPAGAFVSWLEGSYTAVVGLPVHETANLLIAAGFPLYET